MSRPLSTSFRNALQASSSSELVLIFATITHDDLLTPIRVVSEDENGCSFYGGEIVNYRYGGNLFRGCPFAFELPTDDDRLPRGRVTVADPTRTITMTLLGLSDSPRLKIELMKLSDFSDAIDSDNARNPSGTPIVEYTADYLFLRNVAGDAMAVEADVVTYDLIGEPWPLLRSTQDRLPGLFRR